MSLCNYGLWSARVFGVCETALGILVHTQTHTLCIRLYLCLCVNLFIQPSAFMANGFFCHYTSVLCANDSLAVNTAGRKLKGLVRPDLEFHPFTAHTDVDGGSGH